MHFPVEFACQRRLKCLVDRKKERCCLVLGRRLRNPFNRLSYSLEEEICGTRAPNLMLRVHSHSQKLIPRAHSHLQKIRVRYRIFTEIGPSAGVRHVSTRRPSWFSNKQWPMKQSLASLPGPLR